MSKLIQAACAIALAAATTTAFAWYAAPYQPVAPSAEQHQAMLQQHDRAMREAFEAQRRFAEQQMAWAEQARNVPPAPEFPAYPFAAMPEFGQYPSAPEFPQRPEFGQYPAMPESFEARRKDMDAYREQTMQRIEERRAAMKQWSEARRAQYPTHHFGEPLSHNPQPR